MFMCVVMIAADWATGTEIAFASLYVVPVSLAGWTMGRRVAMSVGVCVTLLSMAGSIGSRLHHRTLTLEGWNFCVELGGLATVAWLVSALRAALAHEQSQADVDALTGVSSRRAFGRIAARELNRARRLNRSLTVVFIDLDDFKHVNDTAGHAMGDRLLAGVGDTLRSELRAIDAAGRLGGDEFAIALPDLAAADAGVVIKRLAQRLHTGFAAFGPSISFSFGTAAFPEDGTTLEELLAQADERMYERKRTMKHLNGHSLTPSDV